MFVPPAKDPHAKRNEGERTEWKSGMHSCFGTLCMVRQPFTIAHRYIHVLCFFWDSFYELLFTFIVYN